MISRSEIHPKRVQGIRFLDGSIPFLGSIVRFPLTTSRSAKLVIADRYKLLLLTSLVCEASVNVPFLRFTLCLVS
jgi:hypothetical protein